MISRRSIVYFAIALISTAILTYRVSSFQRTCHQYMRAHQVRAEHPELPKQSPKPDSPKLVDFDPCSYEDPSSVFDRVLLLIALTSVPVSVASLIRDRVRRIQ
jgi:hypothetical protein